MKQRHIIITGAIFLALLVYVLVTRTGDRGFNTLKLPVLPKINSADMQRIAVTAPGSGWTMEKKETGWEITAPFVFPADKNKLNALQRMLEQLRLTRLVTKRAEAAADYDLNTTTARHLTVAGKTETMDLWVGQANSRSSHTFVRLPGDPNIYQVLGDITQQLQRPAAEWRSLQIYEFTTDVVTRVIISRLGKAQLVLAREQEIQENIVKDSPAGVTPPALPTRLVWKAVGQDAALKEPRVNQFLNAFTRLSASKISERTDWDQSSLASVTIETPAQTYVLEILSHLQTEQSYLVRRAGENVLYEIAEYQGDNLLKDMKDFTE